jgi:D-ornithine 4,5-aminomutase subunit alpha
MKERKDDFELRRAHLKNMSDAELKQYFLDLADKIVDPLLELARTHTSKSIERSVLLRMGFSSLEAKAIVDLLSEHELLAKGAGHCVFALSKELNLPIRDAGLLLMKGKGIESLLAYFRGRAQ